MQRVLLLVDLGQIKRNLRAFKSICGSTLIFMVKCNAYGHGAAAVALGVENDVDGFGVATAEEGAELRRVGVRSSVLVTVPTEGSADTVAEYGLSQAVYSARQVEKLSEAAERWGTTISCHLKIDSGMNRAGVVPKDSFRLAETIAKSPRLSLDGIYTHVSCLESADVQKERFLRAALPLKKQFPRAILHAASGDIALARPDLRLEAVRCGLVGYGYSQVMPDKFFPAVKVVSEVLRTHRAEQGENVGYGVKLLKKDCGLALLFGGYGDGLPRVAELPVTLRGRRCRLACAPCMDVSVADTEDFLAETGELAVLVDNAKETAEASGGTIYEVLTAFHGRCEYLYFDDENRHCKKVR